MSVSICIHGSKDCQMWLFVHSHRLSGTSPFFGENPQITMFRIKEVRLDFNTAAFEQVSQDAKDFINSLLQLNPQ